MDAEEIYRTVMLAEESQGFLVSEADRYADLLDAFYHSEDFECEVDEKHFVSRDRLVDETRHLVNVIWSHEEVYDRLEEARGSLENVNEYRVVGAEVVDLDGLESRVIEAMDRYDQFFDYVWKVGFRPHEDPSAPDPIHMKYRDWEKEMKSVPSHAEKKATKGLGMLFSK